MEQLYAYKCNKCGKLHHPHYIVCQNPACESREFTPEVLEGKCKLLTWTRVYNLPEGYMKPWLNFGIVQFENGVTAMGQIGFDDIVNGMELVSTVDVVKEGVGQDQYGFVFVKPEGVEGIPAWQAPGGDSARAGLKTAPAVQSGRPDPAAPPYWRDLFDKT